MIDELVAKPLGDQILDRLDLFVAELDDLARADIDEVIVMLVGDRLEARAAVLEIVLGDETGFLEQVQRPIDGGEGNPRILRGGAALELFDIGMIVGGLDHLRDDAALLGHAHALLSALLFEGRCVSGLLHGARAK